MNRFNFKSAIAAAVMLVFSAEALAVEWNVSLWGKRRAFTEHVEKLAELVSEKTGGEFTLNLSYGGLSKNRENLDGISIGAFEMAQFCAGYHRDKNPTITVLELPFIGTETLEDELVLSMAVYQHPAVAADLARWNATILMPSPLPPYNLMGVGDAPRSLQDYQDLSVRATGGIGKAMRALGAEPTSMSASEVQHALDNNLVQAVAFAQHAHMAFGVVNSGKWWTTNLNLGTVNCPVVANTDALDALSEEHRAALLGSIGEALMHYVDNYTNKTLVVFGPKLEEMGIEKVTYSDSDIEAFRNKVAKPAAEEWVAENAANGLPAQELYDLVVSTVSN